MDAKTERAAIGHRLLAARKRAGVSQDEAAAAAGVLPSAIEAWEKGKAGPCLLQFRALISLYGVMGHKILFGFSPFELTRDEALELSKAARGFSPSLQGRIDVLISVLAKTGADQAESRR